MEVRITSPAADGSSASTVQTLTAGISEGYTKFSFYVTTAGIHEIVAQKKNEAGVVLYETVAYKALGYSQEYNAFADEEAAEEYAALLAQNGRGTQITDPWQVYENVAQFLHEVIDPRLPFIIAAIALLLLDIAVRKFKWKWPHEIVRDRRTQMALSNPKK